MQKDLKDIKNNIKEYLNNSRLCTVNNLFDFITGGKEYSKDLEIQKLHKNPEYVNELANSIVNIVSFYGDSPNFESRMKDFITDNMEDLLIHERGLDYEMLMAYDPEINNIIENVKDISNSAFLENSIDNKKTKQKSLSL